MPYANNRETRIHYHVEGQGVPLVLQHGFGSSLEDWLDFGYVPALGDEYQLILIDARGHGHSDRPHDPTQYTLERRACDVVAVLDDLQVDRAHYLGYSMGGWIGFGLARHAPLRFRSLAIGGHDPYVSLSNLSVALTRSLNQGVDAWVAAYGPARWPQFRQRLLANDAQALIASVALYPNDQGFAGVLSALELPCFFFSGEADRMCNGLRTCASQVRRGRFVSLPGLDHMETYSRSDLIVPLLQGFLREASRQ